VDCPVVDIESQVELAHRVEGLAQLASDRVELADADQGAGLAHPRAGDNPLSITQLGPLTTVTSFRFTLWGLRSS
jgi:hypothetical protein